MIIFITTCLTVLGLGLAWSTSGLENQIFKWSLFTIAAGCLAVAFGDWIKSEDLVGPDDTAYSVIKWICLVLAIIWRSKGKKNAFMKGILIVEAVWLFILGF